MAPLEPQESARAAPEKNLRFLLDCRKSAVYAAKKCDWKVINCCENGEIKSIEKISEEIERVAAEIYAEL